MNILRVGNPLPFVMKNGSRVAKGAVDLARGAGSVVDTLALSVRKSPRLVGRVGQLAQRLRSLADPMINVARTFGRGANDGLKTFVATLVGLR